MTFRWHLFWFLLYFPIVRINNKYSYIHTRTHLTITNKTTSGAGMMTRVPRSRVKKAVHDSLRLYTFKKRNVCGRIRSYRILKGIRSFTITNDLSTTSFRIVNDVCMTECTAVVRDDNKQPFPCIAHRSLKHKVFKICFLMTGFVELFLLIFFVKIFPWSVNFCSCYSQNTVKILLKSFLVFSLIFQHFGSSIVYICAI